MARVFLKTDPLSMSLSLKIPSQPGDPSDPSTALARGFTTFSTFAVEAIQLMRPGAGQPGRLSSRFLVEERCFKEMACCFNALCSKSLVVNTGNAHGIVKNHCLNGLRLNGCMCRKFVVCQ